MYFLCAILEYESSENSLESTFINEEIEDEELTEEKLENQAEQLENLLLKRQREVIPYLCIFFSSIAIKRSSN